MTAGCAFRITIIALRSAAMFGLGAALPPDR
jgi:hypothetical protein